MRYLQYMSHVIVPLFKYINTYFAWRHRNHTCWVNYNSWPTKSSSENCASDLSLLKANALWCENKQCLDSNRWPIVPKVSVLPTTPWRPTTVCASRAFRSYAPVVGNSLSTDLHICDSFISLKKTIETFYFMSPMTSNQLTSCKVPVNHSDFRALYKYIYLQSL